MIKEELSVTDREAFFQEMLPFQLSSDFLKESDDFLDRLLSLLSLSAPASILVLPCLEGNYALSLRKKGFKVTGCADHQSSLEVCQERSLKEGVNIEWILSTGASFCQKDGFNFIFNLDYSFGAAGSRELDKNMLSKFYQSLMPNGKLVMQLIGRDVLETYFHPKYWTELEDGSFLLNERSLDLDGLLEENYVLLQEREVKRFKLEQHVYYSGELVDLLEECKFKKIRVFGDLEGGPYDARSNSLYVVAEKLTEEFLLRC